MNGASASPTRARLLQGAAVLAAACALALAVIGTGWVVALAVTAVGLTVWAHGSPGYSTRWSGTVVLLVLAALVVQLVLTWPPPYLA